MGFVVNKAGIWAGFLGVLGFTPSVLIPPTVPSSLIIISLALYFLNTDSIAK
jgi:hypothetical protein